MLPLRDTDPREVGAYRLLGRLGEGGQGVVFLALSPAGSRAAVKLLPPTTDPQVRNRFLKEVAAAQRVARFCTAQVLDAGIFERRPFIVSEYVSGPSLVEVIEQVGPRGGAVLERIAVATLTALGAVHAVGMVHRDFKPANVLLGPDGPVVIDFGLAAVPGMTTTGLSGQPAVGTPAFMAPEQLAGERVSAAADMWSWGVTMAFAGTGELPFRGESLTATAYAILHSEPNVSSLPEPLDSLVHRCLSKDSATRPTAHGALSELVAAGARLVGPMPPVVPTPDTDGKAPGQEQVPAAPGQGQAPAAPGEGQVPAAPGQEQAPAAPGEGQVPAAPGEGQAPAAPGPEQAPTAPPEPRAGGGDDLVGGGRVSRLRWRRRENGRASWGWRAAAVLILILLVAGAGVFAFKPSRGGAPPDRTTGGQARTSQLAGEAAARAQAVTWILHQVSRAAVVSCDTQVCTDLASSGFPSSNLLPLGPASNDPLGSDLVVATATVRNQFGSRLAVYAPAVIARFGTGTARIDVRWCYPGGAKAYRAALPGALRARKATDAQLLTNSSIKLSAIAKAQLLSGEVDPRLPLLIVTMAHSHPLRIVEFASQSPGSGPASLLRWVDLATTVPAAHLTPVAYLGWMRSFIHAQRAEYHPAWVQQVTLRAGRAALRIGYGAPSPLS